MMKVLADAVHGGSAAYSKAGGIAEETIANIRTVQSFNGMEYAAKKYAAALEDTEKAGIKKGWAVGGGTGLMFFTVYCAYGFGMYYGAVLVSDDLEDQCTENCYDGGRVLIVFFATIMGAMALGQAGPSLEAVFKARAAAVEVFDTIERQSAIDPSDEGGTVLQSVKGHISIQNVVFRYPTRQEVVVCRDFSLEIQPGETIALVGASGCGKSTTVSLLERFYDPESGVVMIDGHDVKTLNVSSLRRHIGLVSQEPSLFQTTIAKNIQLGKQGATMDEIKEAAKMANAYDFIMKMPKGFDTEVGERGVQLSGGQVCVSWRVGKCGTDILRRNSELRLRGRSLRIRKFCCWMKQRVPWILRVNILYNNHWINSWLRKSARQLSLLIGFQRCATQIRLL